MKGKQFLGILLLAALGLTSCNDNNEPTPSDTHSKQRTVVYSVGEHQEKTTLKTDAEWNALLDQFCTLAQQGEQVAFYSLGKKSETKATKDNDKEKTTISTTNREEIKDWMKKMEKEGKTVNVSYDESTGTWNGVAYTSIGNQALHNGQQHTGTLMFAPCPHIEDIPQGSEVLSLLAGDTTIYLAISGQLIVTTEIAIIGEEMATDVLVTLYGTVSTHTDLDGNEYLVLDLNTVDAAALARTWQLDDLSKIVALSTEDEQSITMYWWDSYGEPVYYSLSTDGIATVTQGSTIEQGTWSLGSDGYLCCDIFEGGGCWSINWFSPACMILSREEYSDTEGMVLYQMSLHLVTVDFR